MGWLHRLFHPHCEHCREDSICQSCETLKSQLDIANAERKQMLETILNFARPVSDIPAEDNIKELKPIQPQTVPWRIRKNMLEQESRAEAKILRDRANLEDLEKEVLEDESEISGTDERNGTDH